MVAEALNCLLPGHNVPIPGTTAHYHYDIISGKGLGKILNDLDAEQSEIGIGIPYLCKRPENRK